MNKIILYKRIESCIKIVLKNNMYNFIITLNVQNAFFFQDDLLFLNSGTIKSESRVRSIKR